jgi:mannose-1-phosphate guanylyltransferase/phosphomannomutase
VADGRIIEPDGGWALVLPDPSQAVTRVYAEAGSAGDSQRLLEKWTGRVAKAAGRPCI